MSIANMVNTCKRRSIDSIPTASYIRPSPRLGRNHHRKKDKRRYISSRHLCRR